jgi:hypothetical protein
MRTGKWEKRARMRNFSLHTNIYARNGSKGSWDTRRATQDSLAAMKNIFAVEKFDLVTGFQSNYRLLDTRLAFRSALLWNIFAVKDSVQGSFQSSIVRSKCILCVYQCMQM